MSKYALTIHTPESNFQGTNTLIIEDGRSEEEVGDKSWKDGGKELEILLRYLVGERAARSIVENKLYFIRACDDVDFSFDDTIVEDNGEEVSWEDYYNNHADKGDGVEEEK